jgi:hypothetical protein
VKQHDYLTTQDLNAVAVKLVAMAREAERNRIIDLILRHETLTGDNLIALIEATND